MSRTFSFRLVEEQEGTAVTQIHQLWCRVANGSPGGGSLTVTDNHAVWEQLAGWWDQMNGPEGNEFYRLAVRPAVTELLGTVGGQRVLEIGCGNGAFARYLADQGAQVVATDRAAEFINLATARPTPRVEYRQVDATNPNQVAGLGVGAFDAAVANLVLMDMPEVSSLFRALPLLLGPGGSFVFAVLHPCFGYGIEPTPEPSEAARARVRLASFAVGVAGKLSDVIPRTLRLRAVENLGAMAAGRASLRYLDVRQMRAQAAHDQPVPHWYFHRPLQELLNPAFEAGLVLDRVVEPRFRDREAAQAALFAARLRRPAMGS